LIDQRVYCEQKFTLWCGPCVYEIISSSQPKDKNSSIENLVWRALVMAGCSDFMDAPNQNTGKNSIYVKGISLSGGQKSRITVAKIIFFLLQMHPSIVILDEIDHSIPEENIIAIMNNIFQYCRQNNVCCIVVAHTMAVKKLNYDSHIKCQNGMVVQY